MDPVFPQASLPPSILPRQRNGDPSGAGGPVSPAVHSLPGLSTSPLSRPPSALPAAVSSAPGSASWHLAHTHNGLAPLSAGPEMGSHFTFGAHTAVGGPGAWPAVPPRPGRTPHHGTPR